MKRNATLLALTVATLTTVGIVVTYATAQQRDAGQANNEQREGVPEQAHELMERIDKAVAYIHPTEGNEVRGIVLFTQVPEGVRVQAHIVGLEPDSMHGFHIHRYGDPRSEDGSSAGSHYDPADTMHHDRPDADEPSHAGDMGNLEAGEDGEARYNRVIEDITVAGLEAPIIGRAVVVHGEADEFTQPSGNAGPRIGLGVVGIANPEVGNENQQGEN